MTTTPEPVEATEDPPAPIPESGKLGELGEPGTTEGVGGAGGAGGRGGRGGKGVRGPRGKPGAAMDRFSKWALVFVVSVVALSAIYFSASAQNQLDDGTAQRAESRQQAADFQAQIDCQQQVAEDVLLAQQARSTFAAQQASVVLLKDKAQLVLIDKTLSSTLSLSRQNVALADYRKAVEFEIKAIEDLLGAPDLRPFPSVDDIRQCAESPTPR